MIDETNPVDSKKIIHSKVRPSSALQTNLTQKEILGREEIDSIKC